jgi:acyl carrier protein
VPDAEKTILDVIRSLLERREQLDVNVSLQSNLHEDLGFDSLELAELSAALEDDLGHDPFSAGIVPDTVGELVTFYGVDEPTTIGVDSGAPTSRAD